MISKKLWLLLAAGVFSNPCCATQPNTYIAFIGGFNGPAYIAITPNGQRAYVSDTSSNSVLVIDTNSSSPTFNQLISAPALDGAFNNPLNLAATLDGQFVYVSNNVANTVVVISTATNTIVQTISGSGLSSPGAIAMTPDGLYAYVANGGDNTLKVITLSNNNVSSPAGLVGLDGPFAIAITPNGQYAYVTNVSNQTVSVFDLNTNTAFTTINVGAQAEGIAITPDGLFAYVTGSSGSGVELLNINPASPDFNTVVSTPGLTTGFNAPNGVVVTADGNYAYVSNFLGATSGVNSVSLIDTISNTVLSEPGLNVPNPPPFTRFISLAATPDARYVYVVDGFNNFVAVIYTGILTPPLNVVGCKKQNRFLAQIDFINHLTWSAPVIGIAPTAYNIFRDARLQYAIATIPAGAPREYDDHNRSPQVQDTYYIVSSDSFGNDSPTAASTTPTAPCS